MSDKTPAKLREKLLAIVSSATAIGVYLTLFFTYMALYYYENLDAIRSQNSKYRILLDIDQKSLDYRLRLRGPQPPHPSIGVLAVDDRSTEIVGRWPWPRDTLAIALDNAVKHGAKVIASDIVWSEPTDRPEVKLIKQLDRQNLLSPSLKTQINSKISESDPDRKFGDFVEKNKDKFIIGNFFSETIEWQNTPPGTGFQNSCFDLIFSTSPLAKMVETQAKPIVIIDSAEAIMPLPFSEAYMDELNRIETSYREAHSSPQSGFEAYLQQREILKLKLDFCQSSFLKLEDNQLETNKEDYDPNRVESTTAFIANNWDDIQKGIPEITSASFKEWFQFFSSHNPINMIPNTHEWTLTIPDISNRGGLFGYFNAFLDNDGYIRGSRLISRTGSRYMPSIALQAYSVATNNNIEVSIKPLFADLKGITEMTVSDDEGERLFNIPVNPEGVLTINYLGPSHMVPHASIADLLNEEDPNITVLQRLKTSAGEWADTIQRVSKDEFFKDKILVLGATAIGIFDLRVTPYDENFPGVETHANVIDNLLKRNFLSRSNLENLYMPLFMLLLGLFLSFSLSRFGALSGLVVTGVSIAIVAYVDKTIFFENGILISVALPLLQILSTYVILTFYKYFTEERSKKELRSTFSKYVSPAIVEEILKDPKNLELGGRKERVTVFFSDVRGFTTISEKLDPRALSDLLNSYLTPMTKLVFENRGTLDKYMGDAIMAFFGAPVHYSDHAKMACRCALQSLKKLKELQAQYEKKNLPMIDIGIGLNTGECSVGNMGSETVRSYTVMGDSVNLASGFLFKRLI